MLPPVCQNAVKTIGREAIDMCVTDDPAIFEQTHGKME